MILPIAIDVDLDIYVQTRSKVEIEYVAPVTNGQVHEIQPFIFLNVGNTIFNPLNESTVTNVSFEGDDQPLGNDNYEIGFYNDNYEVNIGLLGKKSIKVKAKIVSISKKTPKIFF